MKRRPKIGLCEYFRPGEFERVEKVMDQARILGIREMRTEVSWADWYTSEGDGWYAWLLPRLAQEVSLLPCFVYTPPSLGIAPKSSSPPRQSKAYADFLDVIITRFGDLFEAVELWNRPDSPTEWDQRLDPDWRIFSEMVGAAAYWVRSRGKKTVLPGLWPADLDWLSLMHQRGVLQYIDAVGLHGFASTSEFPWAGWREQVSAVRTRLNQLGVRPEIWITQTGYSTWRGSEHAQAQALIDAVDAPVERVYWHGMYDCAADEGASVSRNGDEREHHYGLKHSDGTPKVLFELWASGLPAVREAATYLPRTSAGRQEGYTLITGGAGFVGTNLAHRLLASGQPVLIYDDLSRPGTEHNLAWLRDTYNGKVQVVLADVRDAAALRSAVERADQVFHFAAQVAVTTSLVNPRQDFEVNIGGTLNLLEALRLRDDPPPLVFTSTNKIYGQLANLRLEPSGTRYQPLDTALRTGVNEERPLDFHSPYGCSKGAADQYVLDYARTFGIPALVFRMSCIYGPHQMGNEDQGWVAHFLRAVMERTPLVLFGDGMQVRDLLFVDDLVDAFLLAQANSRTLSGQAFNIGGGLGNTASLVELLEQIATLVGEKPIVETRDWRPGDQRYYVSDLRKFKNATGCPKVSVYEGLRRLHAWLRQSKAGAAAVSRAETERKQDALLTY
jgi:CDP-paratose 2-epimerase